MKRHEFLTRLHAVYRPRTYLEVGVNDGRSLALSRVPTIAIDPAFKVTSEIRCDLSLVKATSDDYFAREDAVEGLPDRKIDLAFIDGMHLFEFALRDFINVERFARWSSVVVFDDMLPRTVDEAARDRHTGAWAGDVYKVAEVLREHRPDLVVVAVDTAPTGLLVIFGADPENRVLPSRVDALTAEYIVPDPQDVPASVLGRESAVDPASLLDADFWERLVKARDTGSDAKVSWPGLRADIVSVVEAAGPTTGDAPSRKSLFSRITRSS